MVDTASGPRELPSDQLGRFELWAAGVPNELAFWTHWAQTGGGRWPEEFAQRMNPEAPLAPWLAKWAVHSERLHIRVLDVGAGPVTSVGYVPPEGITMELVATDPLADAYTRIFDSLGLQRPVPTVFAPVEELSTFLPSESFDIVHCRNALDHSFDPLRGLSEMLRVVKMGGIVMLFHNRNEAENEGYTGFHQFNFDVVDGRFVIWRGDQRWDVEREMPTRVWMRASGEGHVAVQMQKWDPLPPSPANRQRHHTAESMREVMNQAIRRSLL